MGVWGKLKGILGGREASPAATPRELFAAEVEASLRADPSVSRVNRCSDDEGLTVECGGRTHTVFLDNLFEETRDLDPVQRQARVARFLRSLHAPDASALTWDEVRPRLAPLLRPATILGAVPHGDKKPINRPFLPFLIECVGVDSDDGIGYASPEQVAAWGAPTSDVFATATANARAYFVDDVEPYDRQAPYPLWHVARDDSYESSRLLVPGWLASFAGKVIGRPVAMVPHRSLLVVGGDGEERCLRRLVESAKGEFEASPRRISPALYSVDHAGRVVPLVLPPGHSLAAQVAGGHVQLAATMYGIQKEQLEKALKEDVFVASYRAIQDEKGNLLCYTTWAKGVLSLLPRADLVLLGLEPESEAGETLRVPWDALMETAGDCLTREGDLDPPRWRTTAWPSAEQVARLRSGAVQGG